MADKQSFIVYNELIRRNAVNCVSALPLDGKPMVVEIKPLTRTLDQNAKLHAILSDIAGQCEWFGQKLSLDIWKRLCTAAWLREENEQAMMIPALDGKGFDVIYEKTSKLSVEDCAKLIEWCLAFGVQNGVRFNDQYGGV